MFDSAQNNDLPSAIKSSRQITTSSAFGMLSRFLKSELVKQDPGAFHLSHWEDLFRINETLVSSNAEAAILRELRLSAPKLSTPFKSKITPPRRKDTKSDAVPLNSSEQTPCESTAKHDGAKDQSTAKREKRDKKRKRSSVDES
jgi:hypothetical protein